MIVNHHQTDGSITTEDVSIGTIPADTSSKVRSNRPNWRETIASGGSASNPYSTLSNRYTPGPATKLTHSDRSSGRLYYSGNAPFLPHNYFRTPIKASDYQAEISQMKAQSILKLYSDVGDKFQAVSSGTLLGELGETIRMLKSPLKSMRSHLRKGLKDAKSFSKSQPKSAAAFWLEWNFGWLPLAMTVDDILTFRQASSTAARFQSTIANRRFEKVRHTNGFYAFQYDEIHYDQIEISVRTIANLSLASRSPDLQALQYGLHLGDVIPTAWELLPWSFAIDYFFDVGSYLNAQKWYSLTSARYALQNVKINVKRRCFAVPYPDAHYLVSISQPHAGLQEFDYFSREPIVLQPPPVSAIFDPSTSTKQKLNLAALGLLRLK